MTRCVSVALLALVLVTIVPLAGRARDAIPTPAGAGAATPAAPGAGIATEVLAVVRLPAAAVPPPPAIVDVWIATLAPGEALAFGTGASPPSIVADVVLGGELVVRSEGRLRVQRAAGREDVPAGAAVTVRPGEAVVYVDNRAAQSFRNPGRGTLTAISFGVFSAAPPSTFTAGAVGQADWARSGLAGHDLTVTVERLTIPPGASLPAFAPDVRAPCVFAVAEGAARSVVVAPTGEASPAGRFGPVQVIGFRTLGEGEQLQVRNAGVRRLVLLRVTLGAEHAATPVAGPHRPRKWPVPACAATTRSRRTRQQSANGKCGRAALCRTQELAWLAPVPLTRVAERQHPGAADRGRAEPQALLGGNRLGTASSAVRQPYGPPGGSHEGYQSPAADNLPD